MVCRDALRKIYLNRFAVADRRGYITDNEFITV